MNYRKLRTWRLISITKRINKMDIGNSYNPRIAQEKFDAIIIGSGISGLGTAAFLSKAGKRVLVLEKHFKIGGYTHTFKRDDYEWDVGVHYIGEVGRKNSLVRRVFDYVSDGNLKWASMDDVYDRFIFPDKSYGLTAGRENFIAGLNDWFPKERNAIVRYMELLDEAAHSGRAFYAKKVMPLLANPLAVRKYMKLASRTAKAVISDLTSDEKLLGVLTSQWGDCGLPPGQISFGIMAGIARHYLEGGFYPVGGSRRFAETIVPVIEQSGGTVIVNTGVDEIIVRNGIAVGVRLENGDELSAPLIISSAGVANTYGKFLRTAEISRPPLTKVEPSNGYICLHIGIKESAKALGLQNSNLWVHASYDHDQNYNDHLNGGMTSTPRSAFISFPSAKDPTWDEQHPNRCTIEIVTLAAYDWFKQWEGTEWKKRGTEYLEKKEELSEGLLNILYEHVPEVRGKVDYAELSTPLTTRDLANYPRGELYGLAHTPERFQQKWLRPKTSVKNLYLTGQDIISAGVTGALFAGVLTTSAILKKNVMKAMP